MKVVEENNVKILAPENDQEHRDIIEGFEKIKMKSAMATVYVLRWESRKVVKVIEAVAEEFLEIDQQDIEFKDNCQKSLRHLLDEMVARQSLSSEVLKIIYFIFEFSLTSIVIDDEPILKLIYDSENLFMQAMGISIIGEGVLEGVGMWLDKYGEDEDENDCDDGDDEDDEEEWKNG